MTDDEPLSPGLETAGLPGADAADDAGVIGDDGDSDLAPDEPDPGRESGELEADTHDTDDTDDLDDLDDLDDDADDAVAAKKPLDPKADLEARRAATKSRMDQGEKPRRRVQGAITPTDETPSADRTGGATATDPTGTRARRQASAKKPVGRASATDPTGTRAKREEKVSAAASAKKVPRPSKRTGSDPKATRSAAARSGDPKRAAKAAESSRYTAPIPRSQMESPTWVPVLMFTLLGAGGAIVLLTYVIWNARPLTLGIGLALILGGILTATQYR